MKLSIVTAMYKSERFVNAFHLALSAQARLITDDYEIIFVDDGSPDDSARTVERIVQTDPLSARTVERIVQTDPHVRLIKLSRNCGQSVAMLAGMRKATGEHIYTSDIDLEDPPELLGQFHAMMTQDPDVQSVYGFMRSEERR